MRVIITGGTGLIGHALSALLRESGDEVVVLTRNPQQDIGLATGVTQVKWDAATARGWGELADGAGAIVNLAGENLAEGRWTDERKKRIYTSRINAGKAVVEAVTQATTKPGVVIQASAVGYYGPRGDEILVEETPPGADFQAQVCFDWEASTAPVERMGVRRVVTRSGIVLSNNGGAWPRIVLPFKLFAGGPIGSGKQYWPFIHIEDEARAIHFLIKNSEAKGPYNLCTPTPLTNREFATKLGQVMGRPSFFPVPGFGLKLVFGEMSTVLLDGHRTIPKRLQELGFTFKYPTAEAAFTELTKADGK